MTSVDDHVEWVGTPAPFEPAGSGGSRRQLLIGAILGAAVMGMLAIGSPGNPGRDSPESEAGRQLLRYVPSGFRDSCRPRSAPGGTVALVDCSDGDVMVRYTLFRDAAAMNRWFERSRSRLGLADGNCAVDAAATGIVFSPGSGRSGRILCYQTTGQSHLGWTDESLLVSAEATRPDIGDLTLYRWWATSAGPLDSAFGAPALLGMPLGSVPSGRYRGWLATLDPADRESGLKAADRGWWILEFLAGRYRILGPRASSASRPPRFDHGTYVLAKYGKLILDPAGELGAGRSACRETFRFRWSLHSGTLLLSEVSDPCAEYPYPGVLSATEWSVRPATAGADQVRGPGTDLVAGRAS
jgi:hypothetical protein